MVARQRERVGEDYTLCALDLKYPKKTPRDVQAWAYADVEIGRKVGNEWTDIRELRIKPVEVADLLSEETVLDTSAGL